MKVSPEKRVLRPVAWVLGIFAALALAFVISPFDATVRGDIGIRVLEDTLKAIPTGLAVAGATFVIDGACALFVGLGLWANPSWSKRLDLWTSRFMNPKKRYSEKAQARKASKATASGNAADLSIAMGVGAGAVLLKYPTAEPSKWLRLGVVYTLINTVVFGIVGYLVAGGANWMADLGFGWLRRGIIRWVPEPLVWTAIFFVAVLGPFLYGEWLDRRGLTAPSKSVETPS